MISQRITETLAMLVIGDSVLCIAQPQRHTKLWLSGSRWWQQAWRPIVERPELTRALGLAGLGFGLWLASREWNQAQIDAQGDRSATDRQVAGGKTERRPIVAAR